jgi:hypothetical protein
LGLGDEILATAWARRAKQKNPANKIFIGRDKPEWSVVWENNPNINKPAEYNKHSTEPVSWVRHCTGNRPYIKGTTGTNIVYDEEHRAEPGDIFLTEAEIDQFRQYAGSILIEPHIKGSFSGNKAWFWDRWQDVARALDNARMQIGDKNKKALKNVARAYR